MWLLYFDASETVIREVGPFPTWDAAIAASIAETYRPANAEGPAELWDAEDFENENGYPLPFMANPVTIN